MKRFLFIAAVTILGNFSLFAQQEIEPKVDSIVVGKTKIDSLYREDQFYFGLTLNLLLNQPSGISQSDFSGGLQLGYLRDMPINKPRTLAIAAGVGWSANTYNQNLQITDNNGVTEYYELDDDDVDYSKNKFSTYLVEFPLEFRWRNSTPTDYKFWRIYAGVKASYLYGFKSTYEGDGGNVTVKDLDGLNKWRYGVMFTFGYNTFNFHFYYSLNPLFDAKTTDNNYDIGLNPLKMGLTFYIL